MNFITSQQYFHLMKYEQYLFIKQFIERATLLATHQHVNIISGAIASKIAEGFDITVCRPFEGGGSSSKRTQRKINKGGDLPYAGYCDGQYSQCNGDLPPQTCQTGTSRSRSRSHSRTPWKVKGGDYSGNLPYAGYCDGQYSQCNGDLPPQSCQTGGGRRRQQRRRQRRHGGDSSNLPYAGYCDGQYSQCNGDLPPQSCQTGGNTPILLYEGYCDGNYGQCMESYNLNCNVGGGHIDHDELNKIFGKNFTVTNEMIEHKVAKLKMHWAKIAIEILRQLVVVYIYRRVMDIGDITKLRIPEVIAKLPLTKKMIAEKPSRLQRLLNPSNDMEKDIRRYFSSNDNTRVRRRPLSLNQPRRLTLRQRGI